MMAGKQPSKEQIRVALGIYLANTPGIESVYDEPTDTYHLKDANGKEATIGPGWHCEDATLRDAVGGILMDMFQSEPDHTSAPKPAQKPAERVNVPAIQRSGQIPPQGKGLSGLTARDIIDYINPKATEQEAYLFAEFCRRKGADPMTKQVYLAIFENEKGDRNVSFIAGKEYFTEKAEMHPQFDGMKAGIIIRPKEGGALEHREGTFYLPSEEVLLGGWAEVFRKDRKIPTKAEVVLAEYNTGKRNWAKMPGTMIRKVAIVQALRESFPQNLGGMYDRSEMDQAGALVPVEVQG
jgi:phage recombination protein Bet